LILFGLGALTAQELTIEEEMRLVAEEAERLGGRLSAPAVGPTIEMIHERRSEVRNALGLRAPDDLLLVGSTFLFDEVERKVREVGQQLNPSLPEDAPEAVRRAVEQVTGVMVDFDPHEKMPAWTQDPDDDYLIEMAFRSDAFAIVSRDRAVVPEPKMVWEDPRRGARVPGFWQGAFVAEQVNNSGFSLDDVDPALLDLVLSRL